MYTTKFVFKILARNLHVTLLLLIPAAGTLGTRYPGSETNVCEFRIYNVYVLIELFWGILKNTMSWTKAYDDSIYNSVRS